MTAAVATPSLSLPAINVRAAITAVAVAGLGIVAWMGTHSWDAPARTVIVVFAVAIGAWMFSRLDDTVVALAACCALVLLGGLQVEAFFGSLGHPTIWLLVGACMLAAGATASGLAARAAVRIMSGARTVRGLAHRSTVALTLTSFAIPATSGRAALAVPVLKGVAAGLPQRVQVAMSLVFPSAILLSAFASLLGAGAHLIAAGLIESVTGVHIGFGQWMLLAAPVALVTAHVATDLILLAFLRDGERHLDISQAARTLRSEHERKHGAAMSLPEKLALATLIAVIIGWCTEPLHGIHPGVVAMIGGVVSVLPGVGTVTAKQALGTVPWPLLTFLAATLAMGGALVESGAAAALADAAATALTGASGVAIFAAIVLASALAHLVVHSRSARASVLLPPMLAIAIANGIDPVSAALASTAAAGLCLTLTSSAKPVAMFAQIEGVATFTPRHLLALSAMVTPVVIGAVFVAAVWWWPLLGVPLSGR